MKGDVVPDTDNVARHCPYGTLDPDTLMPTVRSFRLRKDKGEESISVNWLEYLCPNDPAQGLERLIESPPRNFGGLSKLAVLNVQKCKDRVREDLDILLSFLHDPLPNNESHAEIVGPTQDFHSIALVLAELLTQNDVRTAVPNLE